MPYAATSETTARFGCSIRSNSTAVRQLKMDYFIKFDVEMFLMCIILIKKIKYKRCFPIIQSLNYSNQDRSQFIPDNQGSNIGNVLLSLFVLLHEGSFDFMEKNQIFMSGCLE